MKLSCYFCGIWFERKRKKHERSFCSKQCIYKQKQIDQSDEFTPFRHMYVKAKNGAYRKYQIFDIELNQVKTVWENQQGKCNLSGVDLDLGNTSYDKGHGRKTASLDRIDNCRGYTPDNIQILHKRINRDLKNDIPEEELIYWARKIAEHTKDRVIAFTGISPTGIDKSSTWEYTSTIPAGTF